MKVILDAGKLERKEESHAYLKEIFGFPEYYGGNLDAFYDCLTELHDVEIELVHVEEAGEYFRRVYPILAKVCGEREDLTLL